MLRVVILADSLCLPRDETQGDIPYEATYPALLDSQLRAALGRDAPAIIEKGERGQTIEGVCEDWNEHVTLKKPDMVVVHVGRVDCLPRVFLPRQRAVVKAIRPLWVRERILSFARRNRRRIILARPNRVYTPLERWRRGVRRIVELGRQANLRSLTFITIISPPDRIERGSPGFRRNVELYNRVLREASAAPGVHLVDVDAIIRQLGGSGELTVDGTHLTRPGNRVLAHELRSHVMTLIEAGHNVDDRLASVP